MGRSPEDTRRIKALLLKTFDLKATAPSAPAPETARPVLSGAIPEAAPRVQSEAEAASAAPAPQAQAPRTYATAADVKGSDPVEKSVKYLLGIFALVVLVVIAASYANTSRYQLKPASGGLEIWRGRFAPMGEALMTKIPGMQLPLPAKKVYSEAEALPLVSKYYLDKADALLDAPGIPDFESIRANLKEAMTYATTGTLRQAAAARLNTIDMMVLVYKAEVSATKGTPGRPAGFPGLPGASRRTRPGQPAGRNDQAEDPIHPGTADRKSRAPTGPPRQDAGRANQINGARPRAPRRGTHPGAQKCHQPSPPCQAYTAPPQAGGGQDPSILGAACRAISAHRTGIGPATAIARLKDLI